MTGQGPSGNDSVYWLLPSGGRKFHAFIDGKGLAACRFHDVESVVAASRPWPRCVRCERALVVASVGGSK